MLALARLLKGPCPCSPTWGTYCPFPSPLGCGPLSLPRFSSSFAGGSRVSPVLPTGPLAQDSGMLSPCSSHPQQLERRKGGRDGSETCAFGVC